MVRYATYACIFSVVLSAQVQAEDFGDWEEDEYAVYTGIVDPVKSQPERASPALNHEKPSIVKPTDSDQQIARPKAETKTQPVAIQAAPALKVLPRDPSIRLRSSVNSSTINKNLRVSLQHNYMKEVERWYNAGADVNAMDDRGRTLLYLAIQRRHVEGIEYLLLRNANVEKPNENGETSLHIALKTKQLKVVQMLLERGAPLTPMRNGLPLVYYSLLYDGAPMTKALLKSHANNDSIINSNYRDGKTLLHIAATKNFLDIAQTLINKGATVNAKDKEGVTPLHEAAAVGNKSMVDMLLRRNANIKVETTKKWRPIHHAARFGHTDIVSLLLAKGASANDRTVSGKTPLALAVHLKHQPVIEVLGSRTRTRSQRGWW